MQNETQKASGKKKGTGVNQELYTNGFFSPIIEKCDGCDRIIEVEANRYCRTYADPTAKWKIGICNFATHVKREITAVKIKVNPLKAAKRASKRK